MKIRSLAGIAAILASALVPTVLFAAASPPPPECGHVVEAGDFDRRHYQVFKANGISWVDAQECLAGKKYEGVPGHLATLTSQAEDEFVNKLRRKSFDGSGGLTRPEVWVGGFQESCAAGVAPEKLPSCGWKWVNDEGPISTPGFQLPSYSNWLGGEPNDNTGPNSEQHLAIGLRNEFGWNDEGALGNIGGYIVEYDTASNVSVIECIQGNGCPTTDGQRLLLPPGVDPDGSIGVRTYEFEDPRALSSVAGERCGETGLTLFHRPGGRPRAENPGLPVRLAQVPGRRGRNGRLRRSSRARSSS
jgi:hypothetical protein